MRTSALELADDPEKTRPVPQIAGRGPVSLRLKGKVLREDHAQTASRSATTIRPKDEVAWYRLAQAQRAAGNKEEQQKALAEFRKLHNSTPVGLKKPGEAQDLSPQQLDSSTEP